MEVIKNRSEFLFIYDVKDANPNGDPLDENKPRLDEETGQVIVTDVRLKRTVRDYLLKLLNQGDSRVAGQDIFVKEVRDEEGYLYDAKERARQFVGDKKGKFHELKELVRKGVTQKCLDVRLFGAVIPIEFQTEKKKTEKGSVILTGPVQFRFGRSMHRVEIRLIKGTGAFASKYDDNNKSPQFTFREEWIVPYALIVFHGVANEYAAKTTRLTEEDLSLMMEALWKGTKDLITRSKFGQMPRLLIRVIYKEGEDFYIGELDKLVKWSPENGLRDEKVRDITEGVLQVKDLLAAIGKHKDKIERIEIALHERLETEPDLLEGLKEAIGQEKIVELALS